MSCSRQDTTNPYAVQDPEASTTCRTKTESFSKMIELKSSHGIPRLSIATDNILFAVLYPLIQFCDNRTCFLTRAASLVTCMQYTSYCVLLWEVPLMIDWVKFRGSEY